MTPVELIAAEARIAKLWRAGEINAVTHLAGSMDGGYERFLCDLWRDEIKPTDWVMVGHRHHYHAMLHGMTEDELVQSVLMGKSMFNYTPRLISSAIVAGTVGIGAGLALAAQQRGSGERVWCFIGDAGAEQGGFYEAVWFVQDRGLPCTFIIEDNDSSCGVTKDERRGWAWTDRPWPECVRRIKYRLKYPHSGTRERPTLKRLTPA